MFAHRRGAKRFTLLLLEEEEDYVQDWVGTCKWPASVPGNFQALPSLQGRVRLCTRSLFFEPDDVRVPIVRLPFSAVSDLEPLPRPSAAEAAGEAAAPPPKALRIVASRCTKMKANLAEVPYVHDKCGGPDGGAVWQFALSYAPLGPLLASARELLAAARASNKAERTAALEAFVRRHEDSAAFDSSRLVDFSERLVWRGAATQLTPLVREHGLLVVSDQRVYFQPLHNVSGGAPVRSHPLAGIAAVARRRSSLRPIGLELFFVDATMEAAHLRQQQQGASSGAGAPPTHLLSENLGTGPWWDAPSAFFTFRSQQDREAVLVALTAQHTSPGGLGSPSGPSPGLVSEPLLQARGLLLEAEGAWLRRVTAAWQHGRVSNFDYLLYLNLAAGRSFNDLAQWPVFPWVLSNYVTQTLDLHDAANFRDLSKPVGALNPVRLEEFRKRYRDMQSDDGFEGAVPPFMYGTHYSTPGYVMYWLVRAAPAHMLRLQNGHFDAPDRLFSSIQESWECVNTSTTDVKELTPEFFLPQGDFLLNLQNLPLGVRQSGAPVGDVELPPWASGGPQHFLALHRAALEAPFVSANLHRWIDLVFGFKQRGQAAEAADNVFYYLTYEGAVDLSSGARDAMELKALETQINEFGQVPMQLFHHPHPARLVTPPAPDPSTVFAAADGGAATAGADGDAGSSSRALALALVTTVLAAAAPEFAALQGGGATGGGEGGAAEGGASTPPGQRSGTGAGAAAATRGERAAAAATQGGGGAAATSPSLVSRSGSLFASFLKLGRYTSQDAGTTAAVLPTGGGAAAVDGPAAGSIDVASPLPSPAPSPAAALPPAPPTTAQQQPSSEQEPHQQERGQQRQSPGAPEWQQHQQQLSTSGGESEQQCRWLGSDGACGGGDGTAPQCWGTGLPRRLRDSGTASQAVRQARLHVPGPITSVVLGRWDGGTPHAARHRSGTEQGQDGLRDALGGGTGDDHDRTAGASSSDNTTYVYCVGHGGALRVFPFAQPDEVLRSATLEGDLLCLAALPPPPAEAARHAHPTLLAGSHNCKVHAFSVDQGRLLGSWAPHDDAVCCALLAGDLAGAAGSSSSSGGNAHLITSSWDCSVKVWSLDEGRYPWSSGLELPVAELREFDSGVWAVSAAAAGAAGTAAGGGGGGLCGPSLLVTGTEEGVVQAWDLRAPRGGGGGGHAAWQAQVADDYVGGLEIDPVAGRFVVVATADGALSLLDVRMGGGRLARVVTGASPLRCCVTDGGLCVAGSEAGSLHMWDVALMSASGPAVGGPACQPAPDGQYTPLTLPGAFREPINRLAVLAAPSEAERQAPGAWDLSEDAEGELHCASCGVQMALALEGGSVALLEA